MLAPAVIVHTLKRLPGDFPINQGFTITCSQTPLGVRVDHSFSESGTPDSYSPSNAQIAFLTKDMGIPGTHEKGRVGSWDDNNIDPTPRRGERDGGNLVLHYLPYAEPHPAGSGQANSSKDEDKTKTKTKTLFVVSGRLLVPARKKLLVLTPFRVTRVGTDWSQVG